MGAKQVRPVRGMMPGYEQGMLPPAPGMMAGGPGMMGGPGLMAPAPGMMGSPTMMGNPGMLGNPGIMNAPMMGAPTMLPSSAMLAQPPLFAQPTMMAPPTTFPNFFSSPTLLPQMNAPPLQSFPMIPVAIQPPLQQPCQTVPATSVEYVWPQQAPQPQQVFFTQPPPPPPPAPVQQPDPYFSQTLSQQHCARGSLTPCAWQTAPQSQPTKVKVLNYPPMPRV